MVERERGLSEERSAYLKERKTGSFHELFGYHFGNRGRTMEQVQKMLEKTMSELSRNQPDAYPDGASKEDALVCLFERYVISSSSSSTDEILGFALLWGERFGAGEFDPQARQANLINNTRVKAAAR